jgi:pimeloyl-ACP methyl ester carboxylesterase
LLGALALLCVALGGPGVGGAQTTPEPIRVITADGLELAGALWSPASGADMRPAILLVHGWGGDHASGWPPLARALARLGHLTLALDMRDHGRGPKTTLFEDTLLDLDAGVQLLARRGASRLILIGHSLGSNRVLYYQAERRDPRVRGLVLMAGPGNLLEWHIGVFGREQALAVVEQAQQRIREGRGDELMPVDLGPVGTARYSARHLVSLRGPGTRSDPYANIARIEIPVLILHGAADPLVSPAVATRLHAAARSDAQLRIVPGAGHGLPLELDRLVPILTPWLATAAEP